MVSKTPPMGWNSWNTFASDISEQLIMEMADVIVKEGYKEVGYEYIVIDDCWSLRERDENGCLVEDPEKFPHGMKYLSDYIHSKGLKFGMYSCAGVKTCAGYPGSYGHEFVDAKTFAEWGVDFLKYDFCYFPKGADCKDAYSTMSMALKASGREILFSACNWGEEEPWKWMRSRGVHMYRSTGDIFDNFESMKKIFMSQEDNLCMSANGCFNDIDMLTVGMYGKGYVGLDKGCTDEEYKMHFVLWCLFNSPLMIGGDLRNINDYCKKLLQNKDLIRINQDEEARPPYRILSRKHWDMDYCFTYFKHLSNNEFVIAMVNISDEKRSGHAYFNEMGLPVYSNKGLELTDCFTGENLGIFNEIYSSVLNPHDCIVLKGRIVGLK